MVNGRTDADDGSDVVVIGSGAAGLVAALAAARRGCSVTVVERAQENPLLAEEYLARESSAEAEDPTAPHAAGGAL